MFSQARSRYWAVACALWAASAGCHSTFGPQAAVTSSAEPPRAFASESPPADGAEAFAVLPALRSRQAAGGESLPQAEPTRATPAGQSAGKLDPQVIPAKAPGQEVQPPP